MELISHWETNDLVLITKRIIAFKRKLTTKDKQHYKLYVLHLDLFQKMANTPFESDVLAGNTLLQIFEYRDDPIFKYYTFQNLERWLQAVSINKTFSEVLKQYNR